MSGRPPLDHPRQPRAIQHVCDGTDKKRCLCKNLSRNRTVADIRREHLKRKYGITPEQYDAMRADQDFRCALCGQHEDDLPIHRGGRVRRDGTPATPSLPLVVDHCHQEGHIRGLLCHPCNLALGQFGDNPERLEAAAAYLRRGTTVRADSGALGETVLGEHDAVPRLDGRCALCGEPLDPQTHQHRRGER